MLLSPNCLPPYPPRHPLCFIIFSFTVASVLRSPASFPCVHRLVHCLQSSIPPGSLQVIVAGLLRPLVRCPPAQLPFVCAGKQLIPCNNSRRGNVSRERTRDPPLLCIFFLTKYIPPSLQSFFLYILLNLQFFPASRVHPKASRLLVPILPVQPALHVRRESGQTRSHAGTQLVVIIRATKQPQSFLN